jgi:predicted porin
MKKTLIALAIASAVSAPAFAATSNVDIYGVLNLSLNYTDPDANQPALGSTGTGGQDTSFGIASNASRIGFKGAEDLGGGLAAIWQIESGLNIDEQNGSFASRNSYVGLKGGFGTVLMGNHDTPMKLIGRMVDNFGDTAADSRNILGAIDTGATAYDLRTKNTVAYVTPNFSGFTVTAAYVTDWNNTSSTSNVDATASTGAGLDNNSANAYSINGVYSNGPLMLGAAYELHNGFTSNSNSDMWRIVAGYDIAGFKLAGLYEQMSGDGSTSALSRDAYGLFGSYAMGAWTFKANYLAANESDAVHSGVTGNDGADQWTIGADYSLSKRTTVYGFYTAVSNDTYGGYGLGANSAVSDVTVGNMGSSPTAFSMGVKHSF